MLDVEYWNAPLLKRFTGRKYSILIWTDGALDQYQAEQLSEVMTPIMEKLVKLFEDNRARLPRSTLLRYDPVMGGWFNMPKDLADIVEAMILAGHAEFKATVS